MKNYLIILIISLGFFSCSDKDTDLFTNQAENSSVTKNENILEFTYKGVKYSSELDKSDSDAFLKDETINLLYKSLLDKENLTIVVNSENSWEIYDNDSERLRKSSLQIDTMQKEGDNLPIFDGSDDLIFIGNREGDTEIKAESDNIMLEPEVYHSYAYFHENDNFSGKKVEWFAEQMLSPIPGEFHSYIRTTVVFPKYDFDEMLSSFYIVNQAYNYHLKAYFLSDLYTTGTHTIIVWVKPRTGLSVPSIRKAFGSDKNDRARRVSLGFYHTDSGIAPPNDYIVDKVVYYIQGTDEVTVKEGKVIKEVPFYNSSPKPILRTMTLQGELTTEINFLKSMPLPDIDIAQSIISIPTIKNGKVDVSTLTPKIWNFKMNTTQSKTTDIEKTISFEINPNRAVHVRLLCNEYNIKISYTATLRKRDNTHIYTIDGKFEGKIQTDPYIQAGMFFD